MRAVVFAYHDLGVLGLRALLAHGFDVPLVITHEDDPREPRWFDSVADACAAAGIEVHAPRDASAPPWPERVRAARPDLSVAV